MGEKTNYIDSSGVVHLRYSSESACFTNAPYNSHSGRLNAGNSRKLLCRVMDVKLELQPTKAICDSENYCQLISAK